MKGILKQVNRYWNVFYKENCKCSFSVIECKNCEKHLPVSPEENKRLRLTYYEGFEIDVEFEIVEELEDWGAIKATLQKVQYAKLIQPKEMDILEKKYFKEVFKGHNIIQDDFEYERAKQSAEITTDVAVKFLEWCNQPVYRADGELEFRLRVQPQFPDYKEYIIIDQTGYSILPKGKFLTTHKLFNYFINNHYGK